MMDLVIGREGCPLDLEHRSAVPLPKVEAISRQVKIEKNRGYNGGEGLNLVETDHALQQDMI